MNDEVKNLRRASLLIPYLHRDNNILVYLQKRADNAERHPGCFGLFGGGAEENENPEEALKREMKEELDFIPEGYKYLGRYDSERSRKDVFTLEVTDDFEKFRYEIGVFLNKFSISNPFIERTYWDNFRDKFVNILSDCPLKPNYGEIAEFCFIKPKERGDVDFIIRFKNHSPINGSFSILNAEEILNKK